MTSTDNMPVHIGARVSADMSKALETMCEKYNRDKSTFLRKLIYDRANAEGLEITEVMEKESW